VIGQNLGDITHPESAVEITDNLKPAATPPTSMVEESIVSQFRQFYVRFRSTVSPSRMQLSRFTSHTVSLGVGVCVCMCAGGGRERRRERERERERERALGTIRTGEISTCNWSVLLLMWMDAYVHVHACVC
jgi:hypothetical protein